MQPIYENCKEINDIEEELKFQEYLNSNLCFLHHSCKAFVAFNLTEFGAITMSYFVDHGLAPRATFDILASAYRLAALLMLHNKIDSAFFDVPSPSLLNFALKMLPELKHTEVAPGYHVCSAQGFSLQRLSSIADVVLIFPTVSGFKIGNTLFKYGKVNGELEARVSSGDDARALLEASKRFVSSQFRNAEWLEVHSKELVTGLEDWEVLDLDGFYVYKLLPFELKHQEPSLFNDEFYYSLGESWNVC